MSNTNKPTGETPDKPLPDRGKRPDHEKFSPQNIADAEATGRDEHAMKNLSRGSEGDLRRKAQNRNG